jgi:hypothetical protein
MIAGPVACIARLPTAVGANAFCSSSPLLVPYGREFARLRFHAVPEAVSAFLTQQHGRRIRLLAALSPSKPPEPAGAVRTPSKGAMAKLAPLGH